MILLVAWLALWPPSAAATATSVSPVAMTGTALFEAVALRDYADQRSCDGDGRRPPSDALVRRHARAIPTACAPWWGEDEAAWWTMLALLDSESGGHMIDTSPSKERTFGPYCLSVEEARESSAEFPWIGCPRSAGAIVERLQTDPAWAATATACTIWRYTRMQRGDRLRGVLMYKMGAGGLHRAAARHGGVVGETDQAKSFGARLARVLCLRDEVCLGGPVIPCACGQR